MFYSARIPITRLPLRLLVFLTVVVVGCLLLVSQRDDTSSCDPSSAECSRLLLLTKARRDNAHFPDGTQVSSSHVPNVLPAPVGGQGVGLKDAGLSPKELEYVHLTNTSAPRVKAAFVVLVRNRELHAMRSSMMYLEDRFNHRYNYPYVFLNEEPFTDEFKEMVGQMTKAETHFGLVPTEQWGYPDWINQTYAAECRREMERSDIPYGGSEPYRHMCRYQSGFFFLHPLLDDYDYYWRVEPGVSFSCDIDYDPFRLMQTRDLHYGFTIALYEFAETVPTLWQATTTFMEAHPQYIYPTDKPDSLIRFITDDNGFSYNNCHFWSNFEIASLKFMRSEAYQSYFRYLDSLGGFFYERWGDAPVHSIAASIMLSSKQVHWFYDIGYRHDTFEHCPTEPHWLVHGKCYCNPETSFDSTMGSCIPRYLEITSTTPSDYIVIQPDKGDV